MIYLPAGRMFLESNILFFGEWLR